MGKVSNGFRTPLFSLDSRFDVTRVSVLLYDPVLHSDCGRILTWSLLYYVRFLETLVFRDLATHNNDNYSSPTQTHCHKVPTRVPACQSGVCNVSVNDKTDFLVTGVVGTESYLGLVMSRTK